MQTLQLTKQDLLILDQESNIGQPMLKKQKARLGCSRHAEHFSIIMSMIQYILWNNYYEYNFCKMQTGVDFFIVRLTAKEILKDMTLRNHQPFIYTIPVGSLANLPQNENRTPFSMITASRLATEKHIDWLVRAVDRAKRITRTVFDIYGKGGEEGKLRSPMRWGGRLYPSQRACQSKRKFIRIVGLPVSIDQ